MSLESMTPEEVFLEIQKLAPGVENWKTFLTSLVDYFRNAKVVYFPVRLVKSLTWSDFEIPLQNGRGYKGAYRAMLSDGKTFFFDRGEKIGGVYISRYHNSDRPGLITRVGGKEQLVLNEHVVFGEMYRNTMFRSPQIGAIRDVYFEAAYTNLVECDRIIRTTDFTDKAQAMWDAKVQRANSSKGRKSAVNKLAKVLSIREGFGQIPARVILEALGIASIEPDLLDRLASYAKTNIMDKDHWDEEMIEEALGTAAAMTVVNQ